MQHIFKWNVSKLSIKLCHALIFGNIATLADLLEHFSCDFPCSWFLPALLDRGPVPSSKSLRTRGPIIGIHDGALRPPLFLPSLARPRRIDDLRPS